MLTILLIVSSRTVRRNLSEQGMQEPHAVRHREHGTKNDTDKCDAASKSKFGIE
jgi:hypothetical protein